MGRNRISEIQSTFDEICHYISRQPAATLHGLFTTGGIRFECEAKTTKDNRKFIFLPHGNRIYENDWGYYFNDMGKDGQSSRFAGYPGLSHFCQSEHQNNVVI